ncbi:MAG: hypothetical protein PHQ27_03800 [Victivallales bacterium]|nr:hypothetical protein [Victivallales bacterium]
MNIADFDINLVEKAFLAVVAEQLEMIIDHDIFAGGTPLGYDGVAVRVVGEKIAPQPHRPSFCLEVQIKGTNRREVLARTFNLAKHFPAAGISASADGDTVLFHRIDKNRLEMATVTDNGRVKHLGRLELTATI